MKKKTKLWLIVATVLVLTGIVVFGGMMTMLKWDFGKLSTVKYETNTYEFTEEIKDISVLTNTADVSILPLEGTYTKIVCYEEEKYNHRVYVTDGVLEIKYENNKKWYEYIENIGINIGTPKLTVYIPEKEYSSLFVDLSTGDVDVSDKFCFDSVDITVSTGDVHFCASALENVKIKSSTGKICVENISASSLDLTTTTGKISALGVSCTGDISIAVSSGKVMLSDVTCMNLSSTGNTGNLNMEKVMASGNFNIERNTGDVHFTDCDANELCIKTNTGNVKGNLLTEKIFITETSTGNIKVPKSRKGGLCEISTSTGDIKIEIK
ncbi:MAG: DUF4097 family beta strand repeat protein [Clostridia bacterium]|nr:DUF4097 family beta strand repeat protein [Clostridia bacterium]